MNEKIQNVLLIMAKPYMKTKEIQEVTGLSYGTVSKVLKSAKVPKYPGWGYLTEDVIKAFKLKGYIERMEKTCI